MWRGLTEMFRTEHVTTDWTCGQIWIHYSNLITARSFCAKIYATCRSSGEILNDLVSVHLIKILLFKLLSVLVWKLGPGAWAVWAVPLYPSKFKIFWVPMGTGNRPNFQRCRPLDGTFITLIESSYLNLFSTLKPFRYQIIISLSKKFARHNISFRTRKIDKLSTKSCKLQRLVSPKNTC